MPFPTAAIARLRCEHPAATYYELCSIAAKRGAAKRRAKAEDRRRVAANVAASWWNK